MSPPKRSREQSPTWFATKARDRKRKPITVTLGETELQVLDELREELNGSRSRIIATAIRFLAAAGDDGIKAFYECIEQRGRGSRREGWDFE